MGKGDSKPPKESSGDKRRRLRMERKQMQLLEKQIETAGHVPEVEPPAPPEPPQTISGSEASQVAKQQSRDEGQKQGIQSSLLSPNQGLLAPKEDDEDMNGSLLG